MVSLGYYLKRYFIEKPCYRMACLFFDKILFGKYFDFNIKGLENIPKKSAIIVPNHCIGIDGILLSIKIPKQIHFLIKYEGVYNSKLKIPCWMTGGIPVKVDKRSSNKAVLKRTSEYLKKSNDLCGIFSGGPSNELINEKTMEIIPLGQRDHYDGAAGIAIKRGVDIVPIGLRVAEDISKKLWSFKDKSKENRMYMKEYKKRGGKGITYHINIGKPISPEGYNPKRKEELTKIVKKEICKLAKH